MQNFFDKNQEIKIKHIQFNTASIIPKTAPWDTTNSNIDWEIEKSVLLLYE